MSINPYEKPYAGPSEKEREKIAEQDWQTRGNRRILGIIVLVVLFTTTLFMHGLEIAGWLLEFFTGFLILVGIAIGSLVIPIFVHEMGHAVAGMLVGFNMRFLHVWRFVLFYNNKKWYLKQIDREDRSVGGGVASTTSNPKDIVHRTLIMVAGGPAASLILTIAMIALIIITQLWETVVYFVAASLVILFNVGVILDVIRPTKRGVSSLTDGQVIRNMLNGEAEALHQAVFRIVSTDNVTSTHPRDWNYDLLNQAAEGPCRSLSHLHILNYAYTAALSCQDFDLANTYMDSIQEYLDLDDPKFESIEIDDLIRLAFYLDIAFFEAFYRDDPVSARRWFEPVVEQEELKHGHARAEAAIRLAEGHYREAVEKAEEGKYEIEEGKYFFGTHIWTNEELDALIDRANGRAKSA